MQRDLVVILMLTFAVLNVTSSIISSWRASGSMSEMRDYGDAFVAPDLPSCSSDYFSESTSAPRYYETSEYLMGSVAVGIIILESNGAIDPSTEDWNSFRETKVASETQDALDWWSSQEPNAFVSFALTVNYRVPTSYEPINRPRSDEGLWISQAMSYLGYPGTSYFTQVRDYTNALRSSAGTDWAFAMFIVDSFRDSDGRFADGTYFAYAYLGGPFLVMTYDNDGWGIGDMDRVTAHEIGHIFYATDEYDGKTEYSGYLNVADDEGSRALMDTNELRLSSGTEGQIGWRDSDGDNLQDIVDTFPDAVLNPYSPDPTNRPTLTYGGLASEIPYPNNNPKGTSRDVTINKITNVEFRVDNGTWRSAIADDGTFDEAEEIFSFITSSLSVGTHIAETRGINSVGNIETSPYASDEVTRAWAMVYVPTDYSTIQEAVDAAYLGDNVSVSSGIYYECISIRKSLTLIGENSHTTVIDGGGGHVIMVLANRVRITNFMIRNGYCGIHVRSSENKIEGNNITNNGWSGLYLKYSSHNNISGNSITGGGQFGIWLDHFSNYNSITGNNITGNKADGIYLSEFSNCSSISGNYIANNWSGIAIGSFCGSNSISGNNITANARYGIFLASSGNRIGHNNFIGNVIQALANNLENIWDDGYPSGGNYWSTYAGADLFWGSYQNSTGSDGVGDTPYIIDENNKDHYPLASPYEYWSNPIQGDINKDMIVDSRDLSQIETAYGASTEQSNWNPNCDINGDDKVAVSDLFDLGKKYGRTAQTMEAGTTQKPSSIPILPIFIVLSMLIALRKERKPLEDTES